MLSRRSSAGYVQATCSLRAGYVQAMRMRVCLSVVNPVQLATAVGTFLLASPAFPSSGRRRLAAHHRRLSLIPSEAAAGHGPRAVTCWDSHSPRAHCSSLGHSSAFLFLIFLLFHPSVASLSAAVTHESNESLFLRLSVDVASPATLFSLSRSAFLPSSISSASVPHLCLFSGPPFKIWKKRWQNKRQQKMENPKQSLSRQF